MRCWFGVEGRTVTDFIPLRYGSNGLPYQINWLVWRVGGTAPPTLCAPSPLVEGEFAMNSNDRSLLSADSPNDQGAKLGCERQR